MFLLNNVIYFIQMLATINTPKVQATFGVSLFIHPVLIIQGYNQNDMKYIQTKYNFISYHLETFIYFPFSI